MAIDKLVYGKNVRDSVQANYIKTNEIIDKVNKGGGSDTGLHAYTIYEYAGIGTSFTTTAPITNFKFIELYYKYYLRGYSDSDVTSSAQFVKIYDPQIGTNYTQTNAADLTVETTSAFVAYPVLTKYSITFQDANTINYDFTASYVPKYYASTLGKLNTTNTYILPRAEDDRFMVSLSAVIGYV